MKFTFSQDQLDFKEAVKDFLAGECSAEHLRKMVEGGRSFSQQRWQKMTEMGLTAILVPEAQGGLGMTDMDFVLLAEECGAAALPEPLVETAAIAVPLLNAVGGQEDWLRRIAGGATCAVVKDCRDAVVSCPDTDLLILSFDGKAIRAVENPSDLTMVQSVDPLRPVALFDATGDILLSGDKAAELWTYSQNRASMLAAAQLIGLAQRMVDQAVAYACERQQFGKPIGSFQAIKHHLASVMVAIEFVRPLLYRAAYSVATADEAMSQHVSHAKLKAGEAAIGAAEAAHQVHGAMGYTYEVDLHLWMKRAWALAATAGDSLYHEQHIEDLVFGGNIPVGAGVTFFRESEYNG